MKNEVSEKIKEIIAEEMGIDKDEIGENDNLIEELGVSSMEMFEIVDQVEQEFGVEVDLENSKPSSINELVDYLNKND